MPQVGDGSDAARRATGSEVVEDVEQRDHAAAGDDVEAHDQGRQDNSAGKAHA